MNVLHEKRTVLFICTQNSARSQMAEGMCNHLFNERFEAKSAGTESSEVNRYAITVMAEIGIDLSHHRSKGIDEFARERFDYVVTVCDHAKETCPFFPGEGTRLHKNFEDPAGITDMGEEATMARFRRTRDEILAWIREIFGNDYEMPK